MKKYLLIIAATALTMIGCTSNDTLKQDVSNEKIPFTFSAFSSKPTKANSSALNDFYTKFNVYGWKKVNGTWNTTNPVFDNVTNEYFTPDGKGSIYPAAGSLTVAGEWGTIQGATPFPAWYYKDIRFWDKFATNYQFCAYVPVTASSDVVCTHLGVITIGTSANPVTVDPKDLMATPATTLAYTGFDYDYMTATSTEMTSAVNLVFTHELAKFNVKLILDPTITTNQDVVVDEVSLKNLNGTSYYESNNESAAGYLSGWKNPSTEVEYKADGVGAATTGYKLNGATAGTDNFDGYYVMERLMIPQSAAKAVDGTSGDPINSQITEFAEPCVYVKYTIGSEPFEGYYALANLFIGAGSGASFNFEGGNEYTLNITVGPRPIYFTTSVTAWTNHDAALAAD